MTDSERRLSDIALHFKAPDGIVSSDFPRLNRIARKAGIYYDLWQQGLLYLLTKKGAGPALPSVAAGRGQGYLSWGHTP